MRLYIARCYPRKTVRHVPLVTASPPGLKPVRVEAVNDASALRKAWKALRRANPVLIAARREAWVVFLYPWPSELARMLKQ